MTLSITKLDHYAECQFNERHISIVVMLIVIMRNVVMLRVVMLSIVAPKLVGLIANIGLA